MIAIRIHAIQFACDSLETGFGKHSSVAGPTGRFDVSRADDVFDSMDLGIESPSDLANGQHQRRL